MILDLVQKKNPKTIRYFFFVEDKKIAHKKNAVLHALMKFLMT
jgi:hypothetical protein